MSRTDSRISLAARPGTEHTGNSGPSPVTKGQDFGPFGQISWVHDRGAKSAMECLGPRCATMLLEWLQRPARGPWSSRRRRAFPRPSSATCRADKGLLWGSVPYQDDAPAIRSDPELAGSHRAFAVRGLPALPEPVDQGGAGPARQHDPERPLQDRPLRGAARGEADRARVEAECRGLRDQVLNGREAGGQAPPARPEGRTEALAARLADAPRGSRNSSARSSRPSASRSSTSAGPGIRGSTSGSCEERA